ncbi:HNH/ENDO VII family nuclease [Niallia taxi]|uniref:HNH/ENDO VII family nuclease n=1 Tax=Niallia taxi TaxID=2499688 RepID=UPI00254B2A1E|nr:HNH/ENDO VII family nuclease [Niallia taxi]MDK8643438.1 HNH/ENDO VII family nuclease [Niallia taxi]
MDGGVSAAVLEKVTEASVELQKSIESLVKSVESSIESEQAQGVYEGLEQEVNESFVSLKNEIGEIVIEVPPAEKQLYDEIGVDYENINGMDVYVRNDINPNQTDALGRTNLERMEQGLAPLDETGQSIELHHIRQNPEGPLVELKSVEHEGNFELLHPNLDSPSAIDRGEFAKIRAEHWKARAEMIKVGGMV